MKKLGFIGVGNMGAALLKGFLKSPSSEDTKIFAYDYDVKKRESADFSDVVFLNDEKETAQTCDYIVIAVKPQQAGEVFGKIKEAVGESVIVSICAGISVKHMEKLLSPNAKIVQVMPNTPMMLGLGASAIARNANVSDEEFLFARSIIDSCGISEVVPESKMNEIICINGSSPAFIYHYAKCFADYAVSEGIDAVSALRLFSQTLVGAGVMLMNSGFTPDELISQVTSKGGTTIAGLEVLRGGLEELVEKTCKACTGRAYELGNELGD